MIFYPCNCINSMYIFYYVNYYVYYCFQIKWKNVVASLMEIAVLQLPTEGLEKSTEGVQTEPHRDIDEQVLSRQNIDDYFVNPPPPSMKVTGKRKKG